MTPRSVLVVDDHPSPATSAAHALEAAGYFPVDGTGWLSIEIDGDIAAYRYGAGTTSAPPTSWTTLAVAALPSVTEWTALRLIGSTNSPPGSPTSTDYDDLTIEVL